MWLLHLCGIAHSHRAYCRTKWIDLLLYEPKTVLFCFVHRSTNKIRFVSFVPMCVPCGRWEYGRACERQSVCVYNIHNINAVIEIILNISLRAHTLHFIATAAVVVAVVVVDITIVIALLLLLVVVVLLLLKQYCCSCSCTRCHRPSSRRALYWELNYSIHLIHLLAVHGQRTQNIRSFNFSLINFSSPFNKKLIKWEKIMQKHNLKKMRT